uniref:Rab-GAP TBC domain-containing protein n=1 Tax=Plectus sambesii TaxID=2011161 RepID=A0A914VA63_9BILA
MQAEIDDSAQVVEDLLQAAGGGEGLRSPEPPPSLKRNASGRIADFMRRSFRFKRTVSSPHRSPSSPGFDKKSPIIEEVDLMPPSFFRRQDSVIFKVRPGQRFTQYADVVVDQPHKAPADLGNLGELKHLIQTGRRKQHTTCYNPCSVMLPIILESGDVLPAKSYSDAIRDAVLVTRTIEIDAEMAGHRPSCSSVESGYASEPESPSANQSDESFSMRLQALTVKKYIRSNNWPAGHRVRAELWKELCKDSERGGRISLYREKIDQLVASGAYQFLRHQTLVNDDERLSQVLADWMGWIFRDLPFQHLKVKTREALSLLFTTRGPPSIDRSKNLRMFEYFKFETQQKGFEEIEAEDCMRKL